MYSVQICESDPCGMQKRPVICSDPTGHCDPGQMPQVERRCSNATCGTWKAGDWSMCTRSCDGGIQFRSVTCVGRACAVEEKLADEQPCNVESCLSVTKSLPAEGRAVEASPSPSSSQSPSRVPESSSDASLSEGGSTETATNSSEGAAGADDVENTTGLEDEIVDKKKTKKNGEPMEKDAVTDEMKTVSTTSPSSVSPSTTQPSTSFSSTVDSISVTTTSKKATVYRYMALFWDQVY